MRYWFIAFAAAVWTCAPAAANTVMVNTLTDNGPGNCDSVCTLRDAILSASPLDTIVFSPTLGYPATILLNGTELYVFRNVAIAGPGIDNLAISGNDASRIMEVDSGAVAALSGLTFKNGFSAQSGGGFFVHAGSSLTLSGALLKANQVVGAHGIGYPAAAGGAIYADGSLNITDSILSGNQVIGGRGEDLVVCSNPLLDRGGTGGMAEGGAIAATGRLVLSNVVLSGNSATGGDGGNAPAASNCQAGTGGSAYGGAISDDAFVGESAFFGFVTAEGNSVVPGGPGAIGAPAPIGSFAAAAVAVQAGHVYVHNSVLTGGGGAKTCDGLFGSPIAAGVIYAWGSNFDDDSSCPGFDLHGDPELQAVDAHGLRLGIFPAFGSPLIDAATDCLDAEGYLIDHDVLGSSRPTDGDLDNVAQCDIGAVEYTHHIFASGFE